MLFRSEKDQIFPKKDKTRPFEKIDGIDAQLNASCVRIGGEVPENDVNVYEFRGLIGHDRGKQLADGNRPG